MWTIYDVAGFSASFRHVFLYLHHFRSDNALDPNTDIMDTIKRLQYLRPAYELREKWCYSNIVRVLPIPPAEFAK